MNDKTVYLMWKTKRLFYESRAFNYNAKLEIP